MMSDTFPLPFSSTRLLAPWESFMARYSQLHPECVDWEATSATLGCLRTSKRAREEAEQGEGGGRSFPEPRDLDWRTALMSRRGQ